MKEYLKRMLLNGLVIVVNYCFIMTIVSLTYNFTPFTGSQAFIGIGLTILLGVYLAYSRKR